MRYVLLRDLATFGREYSAIGNRDRIRVSQREKMKRNEGKR